MKSTALGLAVGAGYFLGRTRKLKIALAVGSLVAGKKLSLSPRLLADTMSRQMKDNPQFKEIGDQLQQDLRGVGKAVSGAIIERQMNALADRLQDRTAQVYERLSSPMPVGSGRAEEGYREDEDVPEGPAEERAEDETGDRAKEAPAHAERTTGPRDRKPAKQAPVKKVPAKKAAPASKTAAGGSKRGRRAAGSRTASASRERKGGDER
ncbi:DNA primase [Streptomyces broussonetiae]|uniref:DNA primase n=1 Tax=Streptomyces broussonetiae TaxID=2686304 RepID=A0A6I6NCK7_9ACTN|nr:DNA primase [Streptomyces broussonetiae]QHA09124.1 DNA primase [Streptomyces broussonetiae]